MENIYQSQYQQDAILNQLYFKDKQNGVFVDIGAHDGKTLSNTYFFEKSLNWKGLCIEPLPKVFQQLKLNRDCLLVEGCAWKEYTTKTFRMIEGYSEMLSGLVDTYPQQHIDRISAETIHTPQMVKDIQVQCYDINKLLLDNDLLNIDLLSIDIEGGELEVLKQIDYEKVNIDILLVENNYEDEELRSFLQSKGYTYSSRISIDDVFVKQDKYPNYNDK
jgi:FkbM family methyltransferase